MCLSDFQAQMEVQKKCLLVHVDRRGMIKKKKKNKSQNRAQQRDTSQT